jgi:RNA polymerase sigma-70 factor, ECF subfamily
MSRLSAEFEQIYMDHSDKIFSYIFLLVKDNGVAEDLTQDTFIKVYKSFEDFKGDSSIYTWIIKIARNTTIDYLKRKNRFAFFRINQFRLDSKESSPPEILLKNENVKILYDAIKSLKLNYQEVIILRKIKGFSIKEVSTILDWDETKVKNTTTRALAGLKKELMKRGEPNEKAL